MLSSSSDSHVEVRRLLIAYGNREGREALIPVLREAAPWPIAVHEVASVADAPRAADALSPHLALVDLSTSCELSLELCTRLRGAGRLIFGLYNPLLLRDREAFFRAAARAGVNDFVPLPVAAEELRAAFEAAEPDRGSAERGGRVVSFCGTRGGVGTTTLAANTALVLAGSGEAGEVVLVDGALQLGDADAQLGLHPDRDILDLIRHLDDRGALGAFLVNEPATGLRLLARPRELMGAEEVTPEHLGRVLVRLARRFHHVVVDLPPTLDLLGLTVLDLSDTIFVVTRPSASGVVATERLLEVLGALGFAPGRLRVVVNSLGMTESEIQPGTIAERLEHPVDHVVPFDRTVPAAQSRGQAPVLGRARSELTSAIGRLADDAVRPSPLRPDAS